MTFDDTIKNVFAMPQAIIDFDHYPTAAIEEIAVKYAITGTVRTVRERLLIVNGTALKLLLHDLQAAALRHGASNVVQLTNPKPKATVR
jgi:hypothetical protein